MCCVDGVDCSCHVLGQTADNGNDDDVVGRALSLKLIMELCEAGMRGGEGGALVAARVASADIAGAARKKGDVKVHEKRWAADAAAAKAVNGGDSSSSVGVVGGGDGPLRELDLSHPIRYALGDPVEAWLNNLLCLDCDSFDYSNTLAKTKKKKNVDITSFVGNAMEYMGGAPAPSESLFCGWGWIARYTRHCANFP
jgi:tRNA(Met) C34 N-acetyltransferase TmcA